MSKVEELAAKILKKEEAKEKKCNLIICIAGAVLAIAAAAGIAYAIYRFVKPGCLEDYEDDIDEDFDYYDDEDFFDDEDDFEETDDVLDDTVE